MIVVLYDSSLRWMVYKMVTSHDTIEKIHQVLARHITGRQIRLILDDLTMVPGSLSFRDTVIRLQHFHADWAAGKTNVAVPQKEEAPERTGTSIPRAYSMDHELRPRNKSPTAKANSTINSTANSTGEQDPAPNPRSNQRN